MEELGYSGFCVGQLIMAPATINLSEDDKEYVRLIEQCAAEIARFPLIREGGLMQDEASLKWAETNLPEYKLTQKAPLGR